MQALVDTFEEAENQYNAREESCTTGVEARLREDTFESLRALNTKTGRGEDVQGNRAANAEGNRGGDDDVQELVDNSGQCDQRNQLNVAAAWLGIRRSADIFEAAQREHDNSRRARGSGVRRARHSGGRLASVGVFKVWSSGLKEEIVDGAERNDSVGEEGNPGQREGIEDVAKVLNRIDERSRQHTMCRGLGICTLGEVFDEAKREHNEARAHGIHRQRS